MNGEKKILLALLACLAVLMILLIITYAGAANTLSTKTAAQPPIPKAGPLAQPRSPQQVGLPADQTRAVIPPDNPQTPEKIALGQKLFFDGRLSADGTVACARRSTRR
jgi:cytochrome c peroxidase